MRQQRDDWAEDADLQHPWAKKIDRAAGYSIESGILLSVLVLLPVLWLILELLLE